MITISDIHLIFSRRLIGYTVVIGFLIVFVFLLFAAFNYGKTSMIDQENDRKWISDNITVGINLDLALQKLQDRGFSCHDITDRVDPIEKIDGKIFACVKRFSIKNRLFPSEIVVKILSENKTYIVTSVNLTIHNLSL